MFKFDEICELIRLVGTSGVANLEIERSGERLRIEGPLRQVLSGPVQEVGAAPLEPVATPAAPATDDESVHQVTSPIVGTFYRAPNPDADPYVKPGDVVHKGQVLCIVEAMKLMNEIESDVDGTVVKIGPANAEPVEFGEVLFTISVS